ncbi:MAG: histidine--tRNA ligase [Patescibacteria group bacterium]
MIQQPQTLKGFRDFLPEEMLLREKVAEIMKKVFQRFGYDPLENPALEYAEVLRGKAGEEEQLAYFFRDLGEREVGLRYDQTVPLARFIAEHQNEITFPFKRYQLQKVWRADKPQKGRYREFYQFDFDIVGPATRMADAEVAQILYQTMRKLGFKNFRIRINNRKILAAYAQYLGTPKEKMSSIYRAIDKLKKIGKEGVARELEKTELNPAAIENILTTILRENSTNEEILDKLKKEFANTEKAQKGLAEIEEVLALLKPSSVPPESFYFDPSMVRGLDYYTGIIFEVEVTEENIGSVGGGGRYDNLLGMFTNQEIAATGIGWGFERLIDIIKEKKLMTVPKTNSKVLVTIFSPDLTKKSLEVANYLRNNNINTEIYLEPGENLRDQLSYASDKKIPYAVIIGPKEQERNLVTIKNLKTRKQEKTELEKLPELIN